MGAPVPGSLWLALWQVRKAQMAEVVLVERWEASRWRSPEAGESGRRDAPESSGRWSASFAPGTGESTRVRVVVWWSVLRLVTATLFRRPPPARVAGSRPSFSCLVGIQVGACG